MASKTRVSTKDWRNLPLEKWNVTTFHVYLKDRNIEKYGVEEYVPFGRGPVGRRWSQEKGQIKWAINKYGNEVVKLFIDKCFVVHKFNPRFPVLSFGFMFTYMRDELASAEFEVKLQNGDRQVKTDESDTNHAENIDEDWF
jgi:hypothetical protein